MEAKHAEELRIILPSSLNPKSLRALTKAFDALDRASRKAGGAIDRGAEIALAAEYQALDSAVSSSLGLSPRELAEMQGLWKALKNRRTLRASEPSPESIIGEDTVRESLIPPRRARRSTRQTAPLRKLDEFA
jgi:hypothetical protein